VTGWYALGAEPVKSWWGPEWWLLYSIKEFYKNT